MVAIPASLPRPAAGPALPSAAQPAWPASRRRPHGTAQAGALRALLSRPLARRADRAAAQWAADHARVAANRIFALEHSGLALPQLAAIARRELATGVNPAQATLDSLALAAMAAQRALGMRPHLPQLAAALLVLQDRAVEMPAGEGKTLALALAAAVRALAGMPVQVITRDGERARADAAALLPFYRALGIAMAVAGDPDLHPEVHYVPAADLLRDAAMGRHTASSRPPESVAAVVDDLDAVLLDGAPATGAAWQSSAMLAEADATGDAAVVQAWFGRYRRLGGVSATLVESRRELEAVYGLAVTTIASIYPSFRRDAPLWLVAGTGAWQQAVVARVTTLAAQRRPVVVGVTAREAGVTLVQALRAAGLEVQWAASPGRIAASAGGPGAVTVCDEPAACGDIVPDALSRAAGGLAVVLTGLGATRRADRRWRQLAGRRGHPGTSEAIVPLPAALAGAHAWLPAGLMRSLALACRDFRAWRASVDRCRQARGRSASSDAPAAWPPSAQLQHEGQ